jgi:hypothetical protein
MGEKRPCGEFKSIRATTVRYLAHAMITDPKRCDVTGANDMSENSTSIESATFIEFIFTVL